MIACTESVDWKNPNNEKRGSHGGCDQHHRLMNLACGQFLVCGRKVADQPLGRTTRPLRKRGSPGSGRIVGLYAKAMSEG
jgi:hypothetical protein